MSLESRKRPNDGTGWERLAGERFEWKFVSDTVDQSVGVWPNFRRHGLFVSIKGVIFGAEPGYDYKFRTIVKDDWESTWLLPEFELQLVSQGVFKPRVNTISKQPGTPNV